jgi:hypothetical protein
MRDSGNDVTVHCMPERLNGFGQYGIGPKPPFFIVFEFDATTDSRTDNTGPFEPSLDAARYAGGGTVYAPPRRYRLSDAIVIPNGVHRRGSFVCVSSHPGLRDPSHLGPGEDRTAILVIAGRGEEGGTPFIAPGSNSSVNNLVNYYPEELKQSEPLPYPRTIAFHGNDPTEVKVTPMSKGVVGFQSGSFWTG